MQLDGDIIYVNYQVTYSIYPVFVVSRLSPVYLQYKLRLLSNVDCFVLLNTELTAPSDPATHCLNGTT